jgi:FtsP/CotA-like multicopper oxidase with cupredoxin domain
MKKGAVAVAARYDVKEADEQLRRPLRRPRQIALKMPWLTDRKVPMHSRGFVRTMRHAISPAGLLLLVALAHVVMGQMPLFQWGNSSCPSSYDYCATLEFCAGVSNGVFGFRIPGTTTNCDFRTAPLIRMVPGKKYALTLSNRLTGTGDNTATNLHTHGLHVSGDGNSDDTTRRVTAGGCLIYTYHIRSDHMGGLFWYHAHLHQHTNAQVRGGAMGMLIIEDPANLTDDSGVNKWLSRSNERLLLASRVDNSTGTVYRGNGVVSSLISPLIANEWYRLRVVTVYPDLGLGSLVVGGTGCEVRPVAYDGVWRTVIPHPVSSNVYGDLTGASRIDLAIKCEPGIHRITWFDGRVASLNATNGNITGATPYENNKTWSPPRPAYLQDLRQTTVNNTYAVTVSPTAINEVSWNMSEALTTMQYNTVQEWDIDAFSDFHNFHLHVYPMQVSQCDVRAHSSLLRFVLTK